MTDATTRAATLLKEHRESIDRLDAILVYTLGERFKHTQAVGRLNMSCPPRTPRAKQPRSRASKTLRHGPISTRSLPRNS
jgi:chorismate mutase